MRSCVCSTELQSTIRFCEIGGTVALSRTIWRVAKLLQEFLFSSVWYLLYSYSGQPTGARQTSTEKNTHKVLLLTHILLKYWHNSAVPMKSGSLVEMLSSVWTGKGWFMCDRSEPGRGWTWGHGVTRTLYCRIEDWVCPLLWEMNE